MKPVLKAPGAKRLKLRVESDKLLSSIAFNFNLRHYMMDKMNFHLVGGCRLTPG